VELIKVQVPDNDIEFLHPDNSSSAGGHHQAAMFPFVRSIYDPQTGNAPNRPRQPVGLYADV